MKDTKKQVNDEKLAGSVKEEAREAKQAVREAKSKVKEAKARAKEMKREAKEEAKKEAEAARDPNRKPSLPRRFLTWLLVPAPEKPLTERQKKLKKIADKFPLLIDFILCFILYFIVETMSRHSAIAAFSYLHTRTKVYLYNTFIIFLMTLPGFLMRRRKFWFTLIGALWLVLGAVNGVLLANRVTPFTGPDLKNIDDAIRVSNKYFPAWFTTVLVVAAVFGILCLIRYFFKSPKHKGKLHFWRNLAGFAAAIVAFVGLTQWMLDARQLSSYFSNIANSYLDYGYVYCLGVTVFNTGINEPNNYSEDLVNSVIAEEGNLPETADDVPNFISTVEVAPEDFRETILSEYPGCAITETLPPDWLGARTLDTGGRVASIRVGGTPISGTKMRSLFSLRSASFTLEWTGRSFLFTVTGYGHGAGMSQYGANVMAREGSTWREILSHYYPGTELSALPV